MKRFYSKFRIALMTFALGLASFWMFDGLMSGLIETPVDLPKVKTDNVIVIFPRYSKEMPFLPCCGGNGGLNDKTVAKAKKNSTPEK